MMNSLLQEKRIKSPPWFPFDEAPFYFIINDSGVPIFEYPKISNKEEAENKTVLISGMLSAVNTIAREISGENISNLKFGGHFLTISKSNNSNKLFIFMFSNKYYPSIEKALEIHIEFVSFLEMRNITKLFQENEIDEENLIKAIEPFYRLKMKTLNNKMRNEKNKKRNY